jgi:hypothetical protein
MIFNSVRLFWARSSSELLPLIGFVAPKPLEDKRFGSIPFDIK